VSLLDHSGFWVRVELIAVGIGGGGMTTVVSILFSDIVPLRERGVWYVQCPFFTKRSSWDMSQEPGSSP